MRLGGHAESHQQLDTDQEPDDLDIRHEITIGVGHDFSHDGTGADRGLVVFVDDIIGDRASADDDGHQDRVGDDLDADGNRHRPHVVVDDRDSNPNHDGARHDDNDDLDQSRARCCGRRGGGRSKGGELRVEWSPGLGVGADWCCGRRHLDRGGGRDPPSASAQPFVSGRSHITRGR